MKKKILFFNSSLRAGGKERRLVELLAYLKNTGKYDLFVVLEKDEIHYSKFLSLGIPYMIVDQKFVKKDPRQFVYFSNLIKKHKPDLVHDWSGAAFYALPAILFYNIPLISSLINNSKPEQKKYTFSWIKVKCIFHFSKIILANSYAGQKAYGFNNRNSKVIYNGVDTARFTNLPNNEFIRKKYNILTPYVVIMAASFYFKKKYDLFVEIANEVCKIRDDITFIGVGGTEKGAEEEYTKIKTLAAPNKRILLPGKITDVEALINACDIGVLFTYGEGMPNAIIEYMALGKPVIANDLGGINEIVKEDINGYLIKEDNASQFAKLIMYLIDNKQKRKVMGEAGKSLFRSSFSLEKMGKRFEDIYKYALEKSSKK